MEHPIQMIDFDQPVTLTVGPDTEKFGRPFDVPCPSLREALARAENIPLDQQPDTTIRTEDGRRFGWQEMKRLRRALDEGPC
tara:strand:+ start:1059 stop:1304 length:246 start_codon:yes stop_codon:yes gene_type:complete